VTIVQPPSPTGSGVVDLTWSAPPEAVRFECYHYFPDGSFEHEDACTSPWPYRDLVHGRHRFAVVAFDAAGNVSDPEVAVVVDTEVPEPVTPAAEAATFTFSATEPDTSFQCRIDDGPFVPCTSPASYADLPPGDYRFTLRTLDSAGNFADAAPRTFTVPRQVQPQPSPTPTPTPTPTATPAPTPEFKENVVGRPVSGKILVRKPGSAEFVELDASGSIPFGSTIDSKRGRIAITIEAEQGGRPQRAVFYGGIFKVTQTGSTVDLTLNEALASCKKAKKAGAAAAKKAKTRKLWGDGKGKFRTKGSYSAATVRGTTWLVQDSCQGTLTRVKQGVVAVRDNVRKKTILLRAGGKYLAKPRR
jgi:hypothetical protein